ncbi:hypothetical protein JVX98_07915 [Ensifer sp. PDNC004]|uniref:hypothetical protein n=1 Tax=Ensifer sp. PDNC004 TaxID=2811423 RepID=UPI001963E4EC|nr:hypothetical protein [Ensifer sp. PDNC004]QRY68203.1 hypothetical protein JVX98_07915 [Ensifer sp. PDNC004]
MVRAVDGATSAYVQARQGVIPRSFVWITAKNRATGAPESIGFWNGEDTVDVTVMSGETGLPVTRTYHAWGSLLSVGQIKRSPEVAIRTVQIALSQVSAAVQQAFRGYNTRLAPIEIHRGFLDRESHQLIAPPVIQHFGFINKAPIKTPAKGGEGGVAVEVVSHARVLTRTNPAKRSDESQKRRGGDRFRRYSGVAGQWEFWWGEHKGTITPPKASSSNEQFRGGQ